MKILKALKIFSLVGSLVSLGSSMILGILVGYLQGSYKASIGGPNTELLLEKKKFWADLGESGILQGLLYVALGLMVLFIVITVISIILKRKTKTDNTGDVILCEWDTGDGSVC